MKLTPRQRSVLKLVCEGHSNIEIGRRLGLLENSVKQVVASLLRDTDSDNRTQLVGKALVNGEWAPRGFTVQPIPWQETV